MGHPHPIERAQYQAYEVELNMRLQFLAERLLGATSALAIASLTATGLAAFSPAAAQISQGIYGGGSTLTSLAFRQAFDCYAGTTVGGDGYSFSSSFNSTTPTPGLLPATCTSVSTPVEGLYAAVGSGNGLRAWISDDPHEFFRGNPAFAPALVFKPSINPPFIDSNNANFGSYPYPRLDFSASDAPLANVPESSLTTISFSNFTPSTNWQNAIAIEARSSTAAAYKATQFGHPVQIPAFQVPVAVAVNVSNSNSGATWTIQSALSPNTQAGGAIQLSAAQLCAIFSGTVSDWHDTSTLIPYLDANGVQLFQHFYDDNTANGLTPVAYTSHSLPIKVVYRIDESGTSFIITNYLASACPQLDPSGNYNYRKIFTGIGINGATIPNLPSNDFTKLLTNLFAVKSLDLRDPNDVESDIISESQHWIGALGDNHAAIKVGVGANQSGRIGYLSAEVTQPFAAVVKESIAGYTVSVTAPLSASIQDENQRENGVYHPGQSGAFGQPQNFVAPTPGNAEIAYQDLSAPSTSAAFSDWNIYSQVYPSGSVIGGVTFDGLSILGIPLGQSAYPITGASFIQLWSCYADAAGTRVPALKNWLAWFYGGSDAGLPRYSPATANAADPGYDPNVAAILRNNGFHEFDGSWADIILREYIKPSSSGGTTASLAAYHSAGTQIDGCTGVTGGAN